MVSQSYAPVLQVATKASKREYLFWDNLELAGETISDDHDMVTEYETTHQQY